jgi:hypothetical protein
MIHTFVITWQYETYIQNGLQSYEQLFTLKLNMYFTWKGNVLQTSNISHSIYIVINSDFPLESL